MPSDISNILQTTFSDDEVMKNNSIETKDYRKITVFLLFSGVLSVSLFAIFYPSTPTSSLSSTEYGKFASRKLDRDVQFKVVKEGEPMAQYDELWVEGSTTDKDCDYKMVWGSGTIRLYAKERAYATNLTAGTDNHPVWLDLWTQARREGGWGEPYWDLQNYITQTLHSTSYPPLPTWTLINNDAMLIYKKNKNNQPLLQFVSPLNEDNVYYTITNIATNWGCDLMKFVLSNDGNLVLTPYQSDASIKKYGALTCKPVFQSGNYRDNVRKAPTLAPTISPRPTQPGEIPASPTLSPSTTAPTAEPTLEPTFTPTTRTPSVVPTWLPSVFAPSSKPTKTPRVPTSRPSTPTVRPTKTNLSSGKSGVPTKRPTRLPSRSPTKVPTKTPTKVPTKTPTKVPTKTPTKVPTKTPTKVPTRAPSRAPSKVPTKRPTNAPSRPPTRVPSSVPVSRPTKIPSTRKPNSSS